MSTEDFLGLVFFVVIIFFVGKWIYKVYFVEPQKDKEIALFKFEDFRTIIKQYSVLSDPVVANKHCLMYRENITNGVHKIGHLDYSINDYIKTDLKQKHNYYFKVSAKIGDKELSERTNYFDEFTISQCENEIANLREKIVKNKDYQNFVNINKLR